jgi:K+-sensing histidine kinase KdpD
MAAVRVNGQVENYRAPVLTASLLAPPAVCALLIPFRQRFDNANAALVLVVVIVAVAALGIRLAGVVAAVSSAVWFDFFLTAPYDSFTINSSNDVEQAVLLLAIGIAVTQIAIWGRRQQASASRRRGYLDGVITTSQAVAAGSSPDDLIEQVRAELVAVLGIDGAKFVAGSKQGHVPRLNPDGSVTRGEHVLKVERDGLPTNAEIELTVQHAGETRGHFLLTAATRVARPDLEQRLVAVALADQVGAALTTQEPTRPHL